jgi:hypothetical protein
VYNKVSTMADDHAAPVPHTPSVPADPTPYIRTYAKDVARLTGTQAMHVGPVKEAPTPGVKFAEMDMSQTQVSRKDPASPKEFPQEVISVTKDDTIENLNVASPAMPEHRRDEILERLRARVQNRPAEPVAPTAVAAPWKPTPIVAPTSVPFPSAPPAPKPVPIPPPPAPVAPPIPPPAPATRPQAFAPMHPSSAPVAAPRQPFTMFGHHEPAPTPKPAEANLHTFKSDFSDHINEQKASTFAVLAAQSDVRETRANAVKPAIIKSKKSRLPFVLGAIALVVVGAGLIGGAYWFVALRLPAAATPFTVQSLIFADEKVELPADAASPALALQKLAQEPSVNGNVIVAYITTTSTGKKGIIKTAQPGGPLIKQIITGAPDILIRNINDPSTVGVISAGGINAPFFILQVSSYERTFAGMLGWEPTMATDLALLYPSASPTTSTGAAPQIIAVPRFIDSTVANHDVRVLKDSANQTILIYGYRDKETLIIAKNESAFTALLVRLSAANGK